MRQFSKWFSENNLIFYIFLFIQNIAIFWEHYFNRVRIPWDFNATYYALPAFWTTSVSMGIFPQWIPYQAMGYPLAILAQSGFYYPVFWIFPLLHILYTLHAAVIVQVFHVLFGSIGMFLLLNLIFKSSRYAFIGAVAFQFFGGFYSNAQHPDIIRAFAIAPWLFYVFKINIDKPSIKRRILFIPIVIYFLATGGYPGNFISSLFIITIFLCLEVFHAYLNVKRRALKVGAAMFGLMVIGISMSVIHIGPIWQERNEIIRFTNYVSQPYTSLWIQDIPALFMSSSTIPGDVAMISTFITLPMLIFASFISISEIKKHWIFLTILVISVLMVAGPYSPIWQTITSAVPGLKLSRFPSSDYRVFVAIPIIILGTAGIRSIIECGLSWKEFILRAGFVVTWFSLGVYSLYSGTIFTVIHRQGYSPINTYPELFINFQVTAAAFIFSATILFIIYYFRKNKFLDNVSGTKPIILSGLVVIVLLISLDGLRVINDMQTWKYGIVPYSFPLEKNGKLVTANIFQNIPQERPARETTATPSDFSWKGYLLGNYMISDYGGEILNARSIVESNNIYRQYMLMKWTPLLIDPKNSNNSDALYIQQYYSNTPILDNTLPLIKIGNVATLKGNETIWSTPLKEKNVNYIEDKLRVVALNKTDNHAGIAWYDGNNKEYYAFLRPNKISVASPGLGVIQSVDSIDRQNGKEFTLKIAYINQTIKIFLDDIPRIQIPNITGANAHISKVGIRSFNSIAQFQRIKIGKVSAYQFQNNTPSVVSGKVLDYKYNLTLISNSGKLYDSTKITMPWLKSLFQITFSNITDTALAWQVQPQASNKVVQTQYGINDISYKVTLREPRLMIENEIYFPGWQADLIFPHKEMKLQASVVNNVFRAWLLPPGDYVMIAHYHFPNLIIYQSISIISFGVWIFIIVRILEKTR